MHDKRVEDIMISMRKYPHVPDALTLAEAIIIMKRWQIETQDGRSTIPRVLMVFNEDLKFVGMVRRRDIMRGLQPSFLFGKGLKGRGKVAFASMFGYQIDANISELSHDQTAHGMRERASRLIKDVMIPITTTINHDDHLMKAMRQLVECDTSIIPVLKEGKVVGVLRSVDILHEVSLLLDLKWED